MMKSVKADGVYYRNADGELKRETPYDISLRDFFAGCALMGIVQQTDRQWNMPSDVTEAFQYADAMLRARGNDEV